MKPDSGYLNSHAWLGRRHRRNRQWAGNRISGNSSHCGTQNQAAELHRTGGHGLALLAIKRKLCKERVTQKGHARYNKSNIARIFLEGGNFFCSWRAVYSFQEPYFRFVFANKVLFRLMFAISCMSPVSCKRQERWGGDLEMVSLSAQKRSLAHLAGLFGALPLPFFRGHHLDSRAPRPI